jgi:hypothetical protein
VEEIKLEFIPPDLLATSVARLLGDHRPEDWRVRFTPRLLDSDLDWFTAVAGEPFRPPLFLPTPNIRCLTVNPDCVDLDLYRFAGLFLAICLLHERRVEARLALWLFKHFLGLPATLRDLELVHVVKAGLFFAASVPGPGGATELQKELVRLEFHRRAREQLEAFPSRFVAVVDQGEMLICGAPKISVDDLERNVIVSAPYSTSNF